MSKFLAWLFGGLNFEYQTEGIVGEIIYPARNYTNGWFKSPRWDLVTRIDSEGVIMDRSHIWNHSTVRALELFAELQKGVKKKCPK